MIKDLMDGIYAKFNTVNDFNTAVSAQMAAYKELSTATYPFCVYTIVTNIPSYTFNTETENTLVQFSIFDKGSDDEDVSPITVLDAQKKLWALYDDTILTVTGYTNILMERGNFLLLRDPTNPEVWQAVTEYSVLNFKNLKE